MKVGDDEGLQLYYGDLDKLYELHGHNFSDYLSKADLARAARFRQQSLADRFLASHFLMFEALKDFTGEAVDVHKNHFEPFEKPVIPYPCCHFSLSRSSGIAVVLVNRRFPVGVDVESRRELRDVDALAKRVLSSQERQDLDKIDYREKPDAFLSYWRMKEAILKATGEGLSRDPREISLRWQEASLVPAKLPVDYGNLDQWETGQINLPDDFPEAAWAIWKPA